jgi:hypothetical protein
MQGSGTFFYYTDFTLLRYDVYNEEGRPGSFSALWQATQAGGRPIFAVLFPFELKNALENCLPGRWTQVGAIRDWTIWQLNGPEPAPVSAVPWHEIVYANFGAVDVSGRGGAGWLEIEHNQSNSWIWSQGRSTLEFESLPATNSSLQLKFGTRTLANCHVTINQDGAVLWQGAVGLERSEVQFNFHLKDGHARLDFTSDSPPVPESPRPDARLLSFAVYNAQLSLAHEAP